MKVKNVAPNLKFSALNAVIERKPTAESGLDYRIVRAYGKYTHPYTYLGQEFNQEKQYGDSNK